MKIKLGFWFLLLVFCSTYASAQTTSPKFRINVEVTGDNVNEAESYLKLALRSLGDVRVTNEDPEYTIGLVCLNLKTASGEQTGIAFSWVTVHHLDKNIRKLYEAYGSVLSDNVVKALSSAVPKKGDWTLEVPNHQLWIEGTDSLKTSCEKYIAQFDSKHLEPIRKAVEANSNE